MKRTDVIKKLFSENAYYHKYLEIGVKNPSTNYNKIKALPGVFPHGVDPYFDSGIDPKLSAKLDKFRSQIQYVMTSDQFFEMIDRQWKPQDRFDVVFIDGDHRHEQTVKDLNNALRWTNPWATIVMHDSFPGQEVHQNVSQIDAGLPYTGTVWKTILTATQIETLDVQVFDFDWGVSIIRKTDKWDGRKKSDFLDLKEYNWSEFSKDKFKIADFNTYPFKLEPPKIYCEIGLPTFH